MSSRKKKDKKVKLKQSDGLNDFIKGDRKKQAKADKVDMKRLMIDDAFDINKLTCL